MKKPIWFSVLVSCLLANGVLFAEITYYPNHVEIFTSDEFPIIENHQAKQVTVVVYNLDASDNRVADINEKLKHIPENQRLHYVRRLVNGKTKEGKAFLSKETHAANGKYLANYYGLNAYPAMVFNKGEVVVYGVTHTAEAFERYHNWVKTNNE